MLIFRALAFSAGWNSILRAKSGAHLNYNRLSGGWNHAFSFAANTCVGGFQFDGRIGEDFPFHGKFAVGDFLLKLGRGFLSAIYISLDTKFGPIYLAYGHAEKGQ